jgi:uncharacterized membrane protein YsdA (DUF1294 family)
MMNYFSIIGIALILWNFIVFIMFGIDKRKARRSKWRISESALLLSAALMGGIGALFGMRVFRHKTQKLKFKLGVPLLLLLNIGIALIIWYLEKNYGLLL